MKVAENTFKKLNRTFFSNYRYVFSTFKCCIYIYIHVRVLFRGSRDRTAGRFGGENDCFCFSASNVKDFTSTGYVHLTASVRQTRFPSFKSRADSQRSRYYYYYFFESATRTHGFVPTVLTRYTGRILDIYLLLVQGKDRNPFYIKNKQIFIVFKTFLSLFFFYN